MDSFTEKRLRRMSCAELRKYAKKHGIKANIKAEKIIEELLAKGIETEADFLTLENKILNSCKKNKERFFDKDQSAGYTPRRGTYNVDDEDSFVVLERQILNSCKKNKEELFEEDKKKISDTPRRETYSIDDPAEDIKKIAASSIETLASPELKKSDESVIKTFNQGSAKPKSVSKRKVSFVTPLRRSVRLSAQTPLFNSVKDRPKTPIPSKLVGLEKDATNMKDDSVVGSLNLDTSENLEAKVPSFKSTKRPSTPIPASRNRSKRFSSQELHEDTKASPENKLAFNEIPHLQQLKEEEDEVNETLSETKVKSSLTPFSSVNVSAKKVAKTPPGFKKLTTPVARSQRSSPRSIVKSNVKVNLSKITSTPMSNLKTKSIALNLKKSAGKTPNFPKIHQKIFDKMESIDDYQKRKEKVGGKKLQNKPRVATPAKANNIKRFATDKAKNIPTFGGIPFVPVASTTQFRKLNVPTTPSLKPISKPSPKEKVVQKRAKTGTLKNIKKAARENSTLKQRIKFDLKASLSRKLPYKPHTGPLRPLGETNLNSTVNSTLPLVAAKQPAKTENETVKAKRMQTRELLRGVRKNKRFMLQMNNRMMNMSNMSSME